MTDETYFLGEESQRDIKLYYEITKSELGKGSYGTVQLGKLKGTSLQRAIKIIDKSKVSNVERFKLEVEIMMKLDHPSILRLFDYFEDKKYVYLVLELCNGGELFDRIISNKYYQENEAFVIFDQIMSAIHYCHLNGVCHRDLKPENFIMLSKNDPSTLKVIDFGLSRTFDNTDSPKSQGVLSQKSLEPNKAPKARRQTRAVLKTKAGTPFYIAPEVLTGNYNEKCDVWSAGVILYILFCGYPPFYGENNKEILEAVKKGKLDFSSPEWKDKGKPAIDLIKKMVTHHEVRLFADEVLRHPWMASRQRKVEISKLKEIYSNMKEYSQLNLFRKTAIYFIARNMYEEELVKLHNYFHLFDTQRTGNISCDSFKSVIRTNFNLSDKEIEEVFGGLDIFENKYITYSQFISSAIHYKDFFSEKKLDIFFQLCDIDRNEKLSLSDLEKFLSIQFKYKTNIPNKFKFVVINEFTEMKIHNLPFNEFVKVFSKI